MTKRQREQVVQLLRCAADVWPERTSDDFCRWEDLWRLANDRLYSTAIKSWASVPGLNRESLLEAAARVEEGSWP